MGGTVSTGAVLFTDMVGSTELRSRLGDDRADLLRKHHDDLLADVVAVHRGEVLRWTGDGIKAAFSTASDAVAAAVEMQRRVGEYCVADHAVAPFQVRIGLGAGEITIADGDHHGVSVIEAARLEALARPGEILATDVVRALGHRRANVAFEDVGERTLKGLDHPVLVHRVVDLSVISVTPLPRVLVNEHRTPFVGRVEQIDQLKGAWRQVLSGSAGLVLVSGSAGLGKSRLVARIAEQVHADGAIVMAGVCGREFAVPHEAFAMAFRDLVPLDGPLASAVADGAGPLARLFPAAAAVPTDAHTAMARFELFDAVVALLRRLARLHPVMLVLDDLHWSSAATVLMLRHVFDELADARLLIVATFDDDELGAAHPVRELLTSVRASPRVQRIPIGPLDEADVVQMVATAAPDATAAKVAAIARLVHRETAGSPVFASELLWHLSTTGDLDRAIDSSATLSLPIPESVHDVLSQRLARLPEGARSALTFAAVIGPIFDVDLLADVVEATADDILDLLALVCRAGIVDEVGIDQFAFTQAIVRTALLDGLGASRRARAHRRVAEALEARGGEQFDELARHWKLGGLEARAIPSLERAARRDMNALSFDSARAHYQEIVDLLARDQQADVLTRARAWLGLGTAIRATGDPTYVDALVRAARLARSVRSPQLLGEAAALTILPGTFFFLAEVVDVDKVELCEEALTQLADDDPMRVRVLSTLSSHLTFSSDIDRRRSLIAEAHELASRHDDLTLTASVLNAEFICLWEPATAERRAQIARELGRIARAIGDPEIEFLSGFLGAFCQAESGDLAGSRERLIALAPVIAATRNEYFAFLAERLVLSIDIFCADPSAPGRIDDLFARNSATIADGEGTWAAQTGALAYQSGTLDRMLNSIQALTTGNQIRPWTAAQALALMWAGDDEGAAAILDSLTVVPRNYFWMAVTQMLAEVASDLRRVDHCRRLYDELLPFRGQVGIAASGSLCVGLVTRTLGALALALDDLDTAFDLLTDAVAQADRIDSPSERVIARRLLATALLADGNTAAAWEQLDDALEIAGRHDFPREQQRLTELRDTAAA